MRHELTNSISTDAQQTEVNASQAVRDLRRKAAVEQANTYLVRFTPLLNALQTADPAECRNALGSALTLRVGGAETLALLEQYAAPQDTELVTTLRTAIIQFETIEEELRRRLTVLEPGAAEGRANLAALRAGLAQVAAQQELVEATGTTANVFLDTESHLELETMPGSWAAVFRFCFFAVGWLTSMTIFLMMMFGRLTQVPILLAFPLVMVCGVFFTISFAVSSGTIDTAFQETVILEGREIVIRKKLGRWIREKRRTLSPNSRASVQQMGQYHTEITLLDAENKEFRFGVRVPELVKQQYAERINKYIRRAVRQG